MRISSAPSKIKAYTFLFFLLFVINLFILVTSAQASTPYKYNEQNNFSENYIGSSCTIFTVAIGETVFFGNNEDFKVKNAYQWYIPSQNIITRDGIREIYGAVFFGFDNNGNNYVDTWPQGGMNEYGLVFDANGLPNVDLRLGLDKSLPYSKYALSQVLWESRNVEEVIDWYQNHIFFSLGGQIHYADESGDAVVVSANTTTGQWAFTRKNTTYLVSTNFNLDNPENGDYPCSRYTTATQMLSEISDENDLTISAVARILLDVHQEGEYRTMYSNIFDPVNLDIYFNYGREFTEHEKINLLEKLADEESFEEKEVFFGITGTEGYVLVDTVKINVLSWTSYAQYNTAYIMIAVVLGVLCMPLTVSIVLKRREKRELRKNGLKNYSKIESE